MRTDHTKILSLFLLSFVALWFLMSRPERTSCPPAAPPAAPAICPVCPVCADSSSVREAVAAADGRICFPVVVADRVDKRGQIDETTGFGQALATVAAYDHVSLVLEIGTWFGGGSTHVLATALDRPGNCIAGSPGQRCCNRLVITLELFEPAWKHARAFLQDLPVWCLLGTTVPVGDMLSPAEIPAEDKGEHYRLYYERDRALLATSRTPLLRDLCSQYFPDLVLIDGNEYTGLGEYRIVSEICRPRYLALHDTGTLKTRGIEQELSDSRAVYRILKRGTDRGASWAIYERASGAVSV